MRIASCTGNTAFARYSAARSSLRCLVSPRQLTTTELRVPHLLDQGVARTGRVPHWARDNLPARFCRVAAHDMPQHPAMAEDEEATLGQGVASNVVLDEPDAVEQRTDLVRLAQPRGVGGCVLVSDRILSRDAGTRYSG